jgi:anti-sigma regulatory factor (Ser/Thr protein kinase)
MPDHAMSRHLVLFYRDERDLLDRVTALLGEIGTRPVVLACGPERAARLGDLVGDRLVARVDRVDNHSRPVAALAVYRRLAARYDAIVITEPDFGADPADWVRAARHEAAANLGDGPGAVICLYPADGPEPLRAAVAETHPYLLTIEGSAVNHGYGDPAGTLRRLATTTPIPPPDRAPDLTVPGSTGIGELGAIRRRVTEHLAGVDTLIRTDFVAAVNEVLTNGYLHGEPPLRLTLWAGADRLECRVTDHGPGRTDPTAGYRPHDSATRAGAGLWLARQACDDLDMWLGDGVFTVRLATATAVGAGDRHAGALARAETARKRADLFARRLP